MPVLEVPPSAFKPAPKVDSAVVRLIPHKELPHPVKDLYWLNRVCSQAFNQREKHYAMHSQHYFHLKI